MKSKILKNRGMTIIETLVAVSIFVAISWILYGFIKSIFFTNANLTNSLNAQFDARQSLKKMTRELREASPSSLGAYPILESATSTITFYSNIDSDSYKERVRYFIQSGDLRRGIIKPSGSPLVYSSGNETFETIVRNISNGTSTPLFEYFDKNYTGTSTPLAQPVSVANVRLIRITITMEKDPNRLPLPMIAVTQVMLRNLKDNL